MPSAADRFRENEKLRLRGAANEFYAKASAAYRLYKNQPESEWYWRFRLQTAEALITQSKAAAAAPLLAAEIPDSIPGRAELRVRQTIDRGSLYYSSDYVKAADLYTEADKNAAAGGFVALRGMALLRRGTVYFRMGRNHEAETDFHEVQRIGVALGDQYLRANAFGSLGLLSMARGRYDEAIDIFQEAFALAQGLDLAAFTATTQHNIGWCRFLLGDTEAALPLLESAEKLSARDGVSSTQGLALAHIGELYAFRRDDDTAAKFYERALQLSREQNNVFLTGTLLTQLTSLSLRQGDLKRTEQFLNEALAVRGTIDADNLQYLTLSRGLLEQSKGHPSQAMQEYRSVIDSPKSDLLLVKARTDLAATLLSLGKTAEAEAQFRTALAEIEESRENIRNPVSRIGYFNQVGEVFQGYVTFLMDNRRANEALQVSELSRARLLSDRVFNKNRRSPPSSEAFRRLSVAKQTIFLSYWLAPKRSFLWAVTPVRIAWFELPGEDEINRMVAAYRREIEDLQDPQKSESGFGKKLFRTLVAPARELVREGSNVIVIPDGELYNLNFETLVTSENRYWIEEVTLATAPSLNLLLQNGSASTAKVESVLLIGDPVSPDERQYPKLASTAREIESIEREFPAAEHRTITGAQAVPAAYIASVPERFSLIHFAAHATASREYPLESAVVLSRQGDAYKLYARDIIGHPINARLVTISACRSAGARTYAGEGLVGFAWAFLQAGARSVIGGLWEVDDQSTARLMKDLYREVHAGKSPAESLRDAKLNLLGSAGAIRKPYYWAPFQLYIGRL